jgi:uncharacterized protein (DUF1330 family)
MCRPALSAQRRIGTAAPTAARSAATAAATARLYSRTGTEHKRLRKRGPKDQHQRLRLAMSSSVEPTPEQFAALAARQAEQPVVMVNLLQFHTDGGRQSYLRYVQEAAPHLQRVGGTVRYAGVSPTVVIGDGEKPWWDAILVVEYPSPAAFLDMVTNEDYLKVHEHRVAALDRGDLIATSIWSLAD